MCECKQMLCKLRGEKKIIKKSFHNGPDQIVKNYSQSRCALKKKKKNLII